MSMDLQIKKTIHQKNGRVRLVVIDCEHYRLSITANPEQLAFYIHRGEYKDRKYAVFSYQFFNDLRLYKLCGIAPKYVPECGLAGVRVVSLDKEKRSRSRAIKSPPISAPDPAEEKLKAERKDAALKAKLDAARKKVLKDRAEKQARRERGEIKPLLVLTGHNGEWVEGKLAGHYGVALTPRK